MNRFIMAAAVIKNILYFSDRYSNGLYQVNLDNGNCSFIDYFYEETSEEGLYFQAYVWEKKIYFIPGVAEKIACFDIISKRISYIKLPQDGVIIRGVNGIFAEKFCCQKYKNILLMMPVGYNLFLKFDLSNEQLRKIELPDCLAFTEGIFNWRTNFLTGEDIIFQPWAQNIRVIYNFVSNHFKIEKTEEEIRTYRSCLKSGDYEIFVPWELKHGILIKHVISSVKEKIFLDKGVENYTCVIPLLIARKLYLLPQSGKDIIVISISNFSVKYMDLNKILLKKYESWEWNDVLEDLDKYYVFSKIIPKILVINKKKGNIKFIEIKKEDFKSRKRRFDKCIKNLNNKVFFQEKEENILYEENEELEKLIVQAHCYLLNRQEENNISYHGKKIYRILKGGLR